jgi:hypothetical protein
MKEMVNEFRGVVIVVVVGVVGVLVLALRYM